MASAQGKEEVTDDGGKGKRKRKRTGRGGGDDEDETGRKRKSRSGGALFIDDAADFSDDDDEEEEEEDSSDFSGYDSEMFANEYGFNFKVNEKPGKASPLPFVKEEEISEEEFIRMVEARYKAGSNFTTFAKDGSDHNNSIDSEIYVPSAKDPTIWKVKCMVGQERYSALCLMQKYADVTSLGNKLPIISACALDHVKGFIIMEAEKQYDIYEACKGLSTIYSSKPTAVPSNEISRLLSIRSKSSAMAEKFFATSPSPTKTKACKGPYSEDETECHGRVGVDNGQDSNVATDQKAENFWTRIANRYNSHCPVNTIERAGQQLWMHWSRVQPLLNGIYNKLERDIQKMTQEEYFSIKKSRFKHQNTRKFAPVDGGVHASKRNKTNVDGHYTSDSSEPSSGEGAEGSRSHLPERSRPIGQKAAKQKGKKKAPDGDEENDKLGTTTKVMEELSNAMNMKTAYDITLRDTSKMTPEQLATHNQWIDLIKRKFGM